MRLTDLLQTYPSVDWGFESKDMPWKEASELTEGEKYQLKGIYINGKGQFGPQIVLISDGFKVSFSANVSKPILDAVCKNILKNADAVESIKAGSNTFSVQANKSEEYDNTFYTFNLE